MLSLVILTFGPFLVTFLAIEFARLLGFQLNAGGPPDIPVIGNLLYGCLIYSMIWSMSLAPLCFMVLCISFPVWIIGKLIAAIMPKSDTPSQIENGPKANSHSASESHDKAQDKPLTE